MEYLTKIALHLAAFSLAYGQSVQIPKPVKGELSQLDQRFGVVLEEECPKNSCYPIGCRATRFETLDETQTASLPGLDESKQTAEPQYRLSSAVCEFTYEPEVAEQVIQTVRQRVRQRVKSVGVELSVNAKALDPKAAVEEPQAAEEIPAPPQEPVTWQEALAARLVPFVPWFFAVIIGTMALLSILWGYRTIGRKSSKDSSDNPLELGGDLSPIYQEPEPSPSMLLHRISQLQHEFKSDGRLVDLTLRDRLSQQNFVELCLFLKVFGPDLLQVFRERPEWRDVLATLSQKYAEAEPEMAPREVWKFLDRLERDMIAAKVRIDSIPAEDEFRFLSALSEDELVALMNELNDDDVVVVLAHAPRKVKERIFAASSANMAAKFIERIARLKSMPDLIVRDVAKKVRQIHNEKGDAMRMVRIEAAPLIEDALHAVSPNGRMQLLRDLGQSVPGVFSSGSLPIFLDDALPHLPVEMVTEALLSVSPEEAGQYLAPYDWSGGLLDRLSPRLSEAIRQSMKRRAELSPELGDTARVKIAAFVKKAHLNGQIDLASINSKLLRGEL